MGINQFAKIISKYAPNSKKTVSYQANRGQTWAIDASIFCYMFSYNPKGNKRQKPHVDGFYQMFKKLYQNGIQPLLIFDGKAPKIKEEEIAKRKLKSTESNAVFDPDIYTEIQTLCQLMAVPFHRACGESDPLCGKLYQE